MLLLVLAATWIDFRTHKIPNWLTIGGSLIGALAGVLGGSEAIHDQGILWSISGICVGMGVFLPIYAIGKMGAGDVKLMGMVGSFLGPVGVFWASAYAIIAGGLLAMCWVVYCIGARSLLFKLVGSYAAHQAGKVNGSGTGALDSDVSGVLKAKMPYGCAIAVGAVFAYFIR